jgi:predicted nuclease of predicted toxin-antitoxin system
VKILIDMNLSPLWMGVLANAGHEAIHWSLTGDPKSPDRDIMDWASQHGYIIFTHDLDFGAILAATNASGPSVVQIRTQDTLPESIGVQVVKALKDFESLLLAGTLLTIDFQRAKARLLPIRQG